MRAVLMARGARKIVETCARVTPEDRVLVVTDFGMDPAIPQTLCEAAHATGAEVCQAVIPPVGRDSSEAPRAVGLDPACRLTGNMLEDEGLYGVTHLGTGTSITLGGNVKASCHYDFLMSRTTVLIDDQAVVRDGIPLLPGRRGDETGVATGSGPG